MNILVTGDSKYNNWNEFRDSMFKAVAEIQYNNVVPTKDLVFFSSGAMAKAFARKNDVPCLDFDNKWETVDEAIIFNSGKPKVEERLVEIKSHKIPVHEIKIAP